MWYCVVGKFNELCKWILVFVLVWGFRCQDYRSLTLRMRTVPLDSLTQRLIANDSQADSGLLFYSETVIYTGDA